MAHRRRRFRRSPGVGTRPATAFAPSSGPRGRTIAWEALALDQTPDDWDVRFPVSVSATVRARNLIPGDTARGVVTLERVRGSFGVWFNQAAIDVVANWYVDIGLQLVPLQGGAFVPEAILSPRGGLDAESNKWIWRKRFYSPVTALGGTTFQIASNHEFTSVDIKSRRRFDRAKYALMIVGEKAVTLLSAEIQVAVDFRALFRTPDGL